MDLPNEVFQNALRLFKARLTDRQIQRFSGTKIHHVKAQILAIQSDRDENRSMMDFTRVDTFLEAFRQFEDACQTLQINIPDLASCIWGPTRSILLDVNEDNKALDCILESYYNFGRHLPRVDEYNILLTDDVSSHVKTCLAWMYTDLLKFNGHILKLFESHSWRRTFVSNWRDYDGPFQSLLRAFDYHVQFMRRLLEAKRHQRLRDSQKSANDHFIRYQDDREEIQHHISQYERDRNAWNANSEAQELDRKHRQKLAVISWLRGPGLGEPEKAYQDRFRAIRSEYPKTGGWILREERIRAWVEEGMPQSSILWMTGKKGAGKTILASQIIDHLISQRPDFKTSYFYCRESDQERGEPHFLAICKSLLRQLVSHSDILLPTLHDKRMEGGQEILDLESTAKSLLELFCDTSLKQFIVIDGLDELRKEQRESVMECLISIVTKSDRRNPGKIRVMLVSTDLADMRTCERSEDQIDTYELNPDDTLEDIKQYVAQYSAKLKHKFHITDEDMRAAELLTCRHSNGMFLFAFLVMENLLRQPNTRCFMAELRENKFPKTLKEGYETIIARLRRDLHPRAWSEARKIFGWLACAKRLLKLHELQVALTMVNDEGYIQLGDHSGRLCEDFREVCGSLIQVVGQNSIEFVHQTARGFVLESENLEAEAIECDHALLCLNYLSHPCFQSGLQEPARRHFAKNGYYSFQDYAVAMWNSHLKSLLEEAQALLNNPTTGLQYAEKAASALDNFYHKYRRALEIVNEQQEPVSGNDIEEAKRSCQSFEKQAFYEHLVQIWAHVIEHQRRQFKERNKVSINELGEILEKNRAVIEAMDLNPENDGTVVFPRAELYGDKVYKCTRVTCAYFYEGFDSKEARDHHLNRHERPYPCTIPGCALQPFGFSSNKDRDKHIQTYHADTLDQPGAFPQPPRTVVTLDGGHSLALLVGRNLQGRTIVRDMKGFILGEDTETIETIRKEHTFTK
ncbi:Fc.00g058600.m01.CDS01 [Cosmosporella sp. VM-42]